MKLKVNEGFSEISLGYRWDILTEDDNFAAAALDIDMAEELVRRWNLVETMGDSSRPLNQK